MLHRLLWVDSPCGFLLRPGRLDAVVTHGRALVVVAVLWHCPLQPLLRLFELCPRLPQPCLNLGVLCMCLRIGKPINLLLVRVGHRLLHLLLLV